MVYKSHQCPLGVILYSLDCSGPVHIGVHTRLLDHVDPELERALALVHLYGLLYESHISLVIINGGKVRMKDTEKNQ